MEAIHIQTGRQITNLDYNFFLNFMWLPFVNQNLHPSIFKYTNFFPYLSYFLHMSVHQIQRLHGTKYSEFIQLLATVNQMNLNFDCMNFVMHTD